MAQQRTCITGASGRLGRVLVNTFRERGDEIVDSHGEIGRLNYLVFAHRYRGEPSYEREMYFNLQWVCEWIERQNWEGEAAIVLVASVSATEPAMSQSLAYNLSKAGLVQAARYYATRIRVRCNSLSPGTFTGPQPEVSAQEVANAAAFLCSPLGSGINGQDIRVTGAR